MSLITVDELHAGEPPTLLDVRWELGGPPGRELYLDGHIPGAVFVDLDTGLAGPPGAGGRHPLPAVEEFGAAMRAAGVSGDRPVVVYDAGNSIAAARAWWILRYFGHPDVRVLDGGFSGWRAAGYAIERTVTSPDPGDFVARAGGMPLLDAESAAAVARDGVLIDARAPERFRGEREPIDPVAGRIPGAVNVPATDVVDAGGRFLDADALRTRFADAGVDGDGASVGAYCGSGVAASHTVLALSLAGVPAALYVGSWSDWITDPARPVATGE
jgi:thiosulfate/3-mercaptopyruvate sulfurtransferase